jgi:nitroreductase
MDEAVGLLEAIYTTRAIRRFKPDPLPDELITALLEAATRAPNGANVQRWRFIVIRDPDLRRKVGELYLEAANELIPPAPPPDSGAVQVRFWRSNRHLAEHIGYGAACIVVLFCVESPPGSGARQSPGATPWSRGASIYPAVENMLLAARAYGVGGCLTTAHLLREEQIKALLGIPENVDTFALVPLGYPLDRFGPVRRKPSQEVAYAEQWGTPLPSPPPDKL